MGRLQTLGQGRVWYYRKTVRLQDRDSTGAPPSTLTVPKAPETVAGLRMQPTFSEKSAWLFPAAVVTVSSRANAFREVCSLPSDRAWCSNYHFPEDPPTPGLRLRSILITCRQGALAHAIKESLPAGPPRPEQSARGVMTAQEAELELFKEDGSRKTVHVVVHKPCMWESLSSIPGVAWLPQA